MMKQADVVISILPKMPTTPKFSFDIHGISFVTERLYINGCDPEWADKPTREYPLYLVNVCEVTVTNGSVWIREREA